MDERSAFTCKFYLRQEVSQLPDAMVYNYDFYYSDMASQRQALVQQAEARLSHQSQ